jgi:hypothetical protein
VAKPEVSVSLKYPDDSRCLRQAGTRLRKPSHNASNKEAKKKESLSVLANVIEPSGPKCSLFDLVPVQSTCFARGSAQCRTEGERLLVPFGLSNLSAVNKYRNLPLKFRTVIVVQHASKDSSKSLLISQPTSPAKSVAFNSYQPVVAS